MAGQPAPAPSDPASLAALLEAARAELPGVRLLTDAADRESYRLDETAYLDAGLPGAVALPSTTAEVAGLMRLAARFGVAVVPRGAGTGLSGGAAGIEGALTIALTRMDRILEIDRANLCVVTQPGVINATLKAAVAAEGLFYAPDPASYETCSIGGNLGTNAGGLCCVKYGQTRDSVLGLEVVLADGSVIRTGGKNVKDVAGYSLTHLFVGSQGTLGIITEATLRLRPAPPPRVHAARLLRHARGGRRGRRRDDRGRAAARHPRAHGPRDDHRGRGLAPPRAWTSTAAAMLMVESDAPGRRGRRRPGPGRGRLRAPPAGARSSAPPTPRRPTGCARRAARRSTPSSAWAPSGWRTSGSREPACPSSSGRSSGSPRAHGVRCATFGHAGDGNLHPNFIFDRDDPAAAELTHTVRDEIFRAALALGGTVTAEHGIGAVRRDWLPDPARRRRRRGHALDQGRPRPARHPQPGAGALGRRREPNVPRPIGCRREPDPSHAHHQQARHAGGRDDGPHDRRGAAPHERGRPPRRACPRRHGYVAGAIAPHSEHGDRDINDVYVFEAPADPGRTAIAMTVNPAINLFGGDFGTNVRYVINIDTNGDNVQDRAYVATFADDGTEPTSSSSCRSTRAPRARSLNGGRTVAQGHVNDGVKAVGGNDIWAWAGVRSDPFFFDLTGFIGTTTFPDDRHGRGRRRPRAATRPTSSRASTRTRSSCRSRTASCPTRSASGRPRRGTTAAPGSAADQMGRPAINTVFNPSADKNAFNTTAPSAQATAMGGKFRTNVVNGLTFFSGLDTEGSYSADQAGFLASVLIPDVLVYSRTNSLGLPAPLNGRALADDVIDVELIVTTGGDPLNLFGADGLTGLGPDRDGSGAVNGDGVGPHADYLASFPYLGVPH